MIDRLNEMLIGITTISGFEHVRHVELRNKLSTRSDDYKDWWANELHPTPKGFRKVALKFLDVIEAR
jgi:hypothetical protein